MTNSSSRKQTVTWKILGTKQRGKLVLKAHTSRTFVSKRVRGANKARISVKGKSQATKSWCTVTTGTLAVRAVFPDNKPLPAGTIVRLDGKPVGVTDAGGRLAVKAKPGAHVVQVIVPSLVMGTVEATATVGKTTAVTVTATDEGVIEPATLSLVEAKNGGLSLSSPTVTLRFRRPDGSKVTLSRLDEVTMTSTTPGFEYADLTPDFTVKAGEAKAAAPAELLGMLTMIRSDVRFFVQGVDAQGFTYADTVTFSPGLFTVQVALQAPPSRPGLSLAAIPVHVRYGTVGKTVTSSAAGKLTLADVPGGQLNVTASMTADGQTYSAVADVAVPSDSLLKVGLLGLPDVLNGVPPWQITPTTPAGRSLDRRRAGKANDAPPRIRAQADEASVTVSGGGENQPVSGSDTLTVAKGTKSVTLKYQVSTDEYPVWVLQQSRYNDTWRVTVLSSTGSQLFSSGRSVNSQLFAPPVWNGAGSTGELQQKIDVSSLTSTADVQLSLAAVTTNIGDDILPTTVSATLGAEPELVVTDVDKDAVTPTNGQSDRFSIPRPGVTNTNQRVLRVDYSAPDDTEITNAKVELMVGGGVVQTVTDAAPGTARVRRIDKDTLDIRVTFDGSISSSVPGTPPAADTIRYRVTLKGTSDGKTLTSKPKESAEFHALWRMPDGLARYGARDAGGDDWASMYAYQWLNGHRNLVTRIDDISGEHARNIGHASHYLGRDIDMFHVYTFPNGGASGSQNYLQMQADAQAALNGNQAANARLAAWATATRTRFDDLLNDPDVTRIYYAIGSPAGQLGGGWARDLLTSGAYTAPNGRTINLGVGTWTGQNVTYNAVHNSHFHVQLTR